MNGIDATHFHKLYGVRKQRITYQKKDFLDYTLMTLISGFIVCFSLGARHSLSIAAMLLCVWMIVMFPIRHGLELRLPLLFVRPQEVLYSLIHKIQNLKLAYFLAVGALIIENGFIYLTPGLPHHVELMRKIALYALYAHFIAITLYRTAILVSHLAKRERVREILMQSIWKTSLQRQPRISLEILHAYFTGLLTHIVYLVPWYLVITHVNFSIILFPITAVAAVLIQQKYQNVLNDWFYRDHWLGHNSEFEFVYLHGTHHDAIPSSLIGVGGNGHLEGFFRGFVGFPIPFYNPVMAAIAFTISVKLDMDLHQYIPGVFPRLPRGFYEIGQHSTHHFGRIEPYGFAFKDTEKRYKSVAPELKNSADLDEQLNGYVWDNPRHRWFLDLVDQYEQKADAPLTEDKAT